MLELFPPGCVGLLSLLQFLLALSAELPPGFVGKVCRAALLLQRAPSGICGFALGARTPPRVAQGARFPPQPSFLLSVGEFFGLDRWLRSSRRLCLRERSRDKGLHGRSVIQGGVFKDPPWL
ncbi:hypothetical protein ANRL2_00970 [Anaerolineae bacterium]|nr:hypothetical protein ANRL2_00970 [Anaerolineae bacterium]